MPCRVCRTSRTKRLVIGNKIYHHCLQCGSICLDPSLFPSAEEERKRYSLHHNDLRDLGYRSYLEGFIDPVLTYVRGQTKQVSTFFDYGCGPAPSLAAIAGERGLTARGWDPFFAPDIERFAEGADLVACHEVAEHFFDPFAEFKRLVASVKSGGYLAIATQTLPAEYDTAFFESWWYRQDITHVSFFTLQGLIALGESAGLRWIGQIGERAFVFEKIN